MYDLVPKLAAHITSSADFVVLWWSTARGAGGAARPTVPIRRSPPSGAPRSSAGVRRLPRMSRAVGCMHGTRSLRHDGARRSVLDGASPVMWSVVKVRTPGRAERRGGACSTWSAVKVRTPGHTERRRPWSRLPVKARTPGRTGRPSVRVDMPGRTERRVGARPGRGARSGSVHRGIRRDGVRGRCCQSRSVRRGVRGLRHAGAC